MRWNDPAPGERKAGERSWEVVRTAWEGRSPSAHPHTIRRAPLVAIAVGVAVAAAALSPPGLAVLGSIRDAVRGEKNAKPALFSLPTKGRLLVESTRGVWVVQPDGSKRLLAGYRDASWSPNGKYLAALHGQELRALEPDGAVHWSLARSGRIRFPVWSDATPPCCRIAYLAGRQIRVVDGDATNDRLLASDATAVAPVWKPGTHLLAYADRAGTVRVVDADARRLVRTVRPVAPAFGLGWSSSGRLLVWSTHAIEVFAPNGGRLQPLGPGAAPVTAAAFSPSGRSIAFVQQTASRSVLWLYPRLRADGTAARRIFGGAGVFGTLAWSPDGRWLALGWDSADQLLFIRSPSVGKIVPISNVAANFGANAALGGWCCP